MCHNCCFKLYNKGEQAPHTIRSLIEEFCSLNEDCRVFAIGCWRVSRWEKRAGLSIHTARALGAKAGIFAILLIFKISHHCFILICNSLY